MVKTRTTEASENAKRVLGPFLGAIYGAPARDRRVDVFWREDLDKRTLNYQKLLPEAEKALDHHRVHRQLKQAT